jgi:hypothetical protein
VDALEALLLLLRNGSNETMAESARLSGTLETVEVELSTAIPMAPGIIRTLAAKWISGAREEISATTRHLRVVANSPV